MSAGIASLDARHEAALLDHFERLAAANGRDGQPLTSPRPPGTPFGPRDRYRAELLEGWARPLDADGWLRTWGLVADDGKIVGHADLRARREPSTAHRALATIGIQRSFHRRGFGRALMTTMIGWARAQPQLDWIDLYVFEHNAAARALYAGLGFVEVGRMVDMFRVAGVQVTDLCLTLRLRT